MYISEFKPADIATVVILAVVDDVIVKVAVSILSATGVVKVNDFETIVISPLFAEAVPFATEIEAVVMAGSVA